LAEWFRAVSCRAKSSRVELQQRLIVWACW
jgi:hypothetical protein